MAYGFGLLAIGSHSRRAGRGGAFALAFCRELAPILTAAILAGQVGTAFAAEIGCMKVTDQIDVTLQKDGTVEEAVQQNIEYIKTETLTANLDLAEEVNNGLEVSFDEVTTRLLIKKH